jgi:phosphoglycolate phosphatase-like HAD superfamily hydrolase
MSFDAVIFDLDDTLLDTRALAPYRDARNWRECFARLDLAVPFVVEGDEVRVEELPALVAERGMAVGLLTHSPAPYAEGLLRKFSVRVEAMVTGSDGYAPKPNPSGLEAVARELGVAPERCLYVGDSVGDFGAAAAARMSSSGVAWDGKFPGDWQRGWPDAAVVSTSRLLEFVDGNNALRPLGEVLAGDETPEVHRGSLLRLGGGRYGLGRYFNMGDHRYPSHALSQLVISAKDDVVSAEVVARIFDFLALNATARPPDLVVSVPPAPGQTYDRFEQSRARLSEAWGARDGGGSLRMSFEVEGYKGMSFDERRAHNVGRFQSDELDRENVVLIDDVLTSGGQADACRDALREAGAGQVTVVALAVAQAELPELCPQCNGSLRTIYGRNGPFVGCTNYFTTGCPYTRDLPATN